MSRQVGALWNTHGDSVVPYDYVVGYSILCEFVDDAGSVIMSTTDFYLPLGCLISGREILGSKSWPFWRAPPLNQRGFVKPGLEVVLLNDQSELDPLHSGASLLGGSKIWLACWSPAKSWVWGMGKLIYIYIYIYPRKAMRLHVVLEARRTKKHLYQSWLSQSSLFSQS